MWRSARKNGSGFITIPGPPPNGVSSTTRCRSDGEVPQVVHRHVDDPALVRAGHDPVPEERRHHLRKDRDDVDSHHPSDAGFVARSPGRRVQLQQSRPADRSRCACRRRRSPGRCDSASGTSTSSRPVPTTEQRRAAFLVHPLDPTDVGALCASEPGTPPGPNDSSARLRAAADPPRESTAPAAPAARPPRSTRTPSNDDDRPALMEAQARHRQRLQPSVDRPPARWPPARTARRRSRSPG